MARFKSVKTEFASLPNSVIQGFYLSANAIAVLITCLSYPNDWKYRPVSIWKNLKLSRDKTYAAFDELVEKGHCIRIRTFKGNLKSEVDYIFFDQILTCQQYVKDNDKELSSSSLQVEHKWNFKKSLRHPDPREPEPREPEDQEVSKKNETKTIEQKRSLKESNQQNVHNSPSPEVRSSSTASIPFQRKDYSIDVSAPEVLEILEMEPQTKPYFRPEIVVRWIGKFGPVMTLETIKFFLHIKATQKKPIPKPEAWMEAAFVKKYAEVDKTCQQNKQFAENLKKHYRLSRLKINKRYCQDTETGKDYYYHLPPDVFQESIKQLIE